MVRDYSIITANAGTRVTVRAIISSSLIARLRAPLTVSGWLLVRLLWMNPITLSVSAAILFDRRLVILPYGCWSLKNWHASRTMDVKKSVGNEPKVIASATSIGVVMRQLVLLMILAHWFALHSETS